MLIDKIHPLSWDQRRKLIIPGDYNITLIFCIEHFIAACNEAVRDHGSFFVALSGGSTPKAIFERLCQPPHTSQIDWSKVYLFWGDERSVPPTDPDSNYHMAMEAGFDHMPIPPTQIFRMHAEEKIEENALLYEKTIKQALGERPFDLIMLGMGEDGHTASLFPNTQGLDVKNRLVVANFIPQKKTWRMSLTYECINKAKHIAFYVLGASKKHMLDQVLNASEKDYKTLPSAKIGEKDHPALWIADEAAAILVMAKINNKP